MKWEVIFYKDKRDNPPLIKFLDSLQAKESAKIARSIDLLEEYGLALGIPHIKKIEQNLWELRIIFGGNIFRIFFSIMQMKIVLLHGFRKKTQKTPRNEIDIAKNRLKEISI